MSAPATYCFDCGTFDDDNFDVSTFIHMQSLTSSLDILSDDLARFLSKLRASIVDAVKHEQVNLSTLSCDLDEAGGMLAALREPVSTIRDRLRAVDVAVAASLEAVEEKLEQRQQLRDDRRSLELCLRISDGIENVERLLRNSAPGGDSGDGGNDADSTHRMTAAAVLERVSQCYSALAVDLELGAHFAFVRGFIPRAEALEASLVERLELCFGAEVVPDAMYRRQRHRVHPVVLAHCLRAFAAMDRVSYVEDLYARLVVRPFVDRALTAARISRGGDGRLAEILSELLTFAQEQCGALIEVAASDGVAACGYDFLGNAVWREAEEALRCKCDAIFSTAVPKAFRARHLAAMRFLTQVEECFLGATPRESTTSDFAATCDTTVSLKRSAWRNHAATRRFVRQWHAQVPIYFELRAGALTTGLASGLAAAASGSSVQCDERDADIRAAVGEANSGCDTDACPLADGGIAAAEASGSGVFCLPSSKALWQCLLDCWDGEYFLAELASHFLKHTMQLLAQHYSWLLRRAEARVRDQGESGPEIGAAAELAATIADVGRLWQAIDTHLIQVMGNTLQDHGIAVDEASVQIARKCLEDAFSSTRELAARLTDQLRHMFVRRCDAALAAIRSIPSMYRMTNKPPPTTPSPYVVKVLKPLKPFVSDWRDTLGHATCDEWTEGVCGAVVDRYLSKVSELLVDVREKEAVTAARGKAKKKQGEMSDTDKIVAQLSLDAQAFGAELLAIGVDPGTVPSFARLLDAVQPTSSQADQT